MLNHFKALENDVLFLYFRFEMMIPARPSISSPELLELGMSLVPFQISYDIEIHTEMHHD